MQGGFESEKGGELLTGIGRSRVTCPRCPHTYVYRNGHIYRVTAHLPHGIDGFPELLLRPVP